MGSVSVSQTVQCPSSAAQRAHIQPVQRNSPAVRTDAVYVVHTSLHETLAALRGAGDFARALSVPLTVIRFRTGTHDAVPNDAERASPIETQGFFTRLREENPGIRGRVYVCSNELRAIPLAFRPQSLIVIAGRRSWWPTQSESNGSGAQRHAGARAAGTCRNAGRPGRHQDNRGVRAESRYHADLRRP